MIEYTKKHFNILNFYTDIPHDKLGTLFVFGLNENRNRLEAFKIYFDQFRNVIIEQICENIESSIMIFKPQLERLDLNKITTDLDWTTFPNAVASLTEVMKLQKQEDDLTNESIKVGIGGEIQLTVLSNENNYFAIQTSFIHKFSDYDVLYALMKLKD